MYDQSELDDGHDVEAECSVCGFLTLEPNDLGECPQCEDRRHQTLRSQPMEIGETRIVGNPNFLRNLVDEISAEPKGHH